MEEECKGCNNFSMCNKCMNGEQWAFIEEKGSEELENKIQDFFDRWMEDSEYNQAVMPNFCCASLEDCKNIARHFAKWQKEQMMKDVFEYTKEHNTACVLASECLRNNGWFSRERDFNDLFRHLSCVDELFEGKFSGKTKIIVIKEE